MTTIQKIIPIGHPNRPGTKLEALKAIGFHYTANDRPTADDTMNAGYFARSWHVGADGKPAEWTWITKKDEKGAVILNTYTGKAALFKVEVPFRYGSTQIIADEDSVTMAIPTNEAAWAWGDRNAGPWTPELKGQMPLARDLFGFRQNFQSISVEICNNASWERAMMNAAMWTIDFLKEKGLVVDVDYSLDPQAKRELKPGTIILARHGDVTGKLCPKPLMDSFESWAAFVQFIAIG